MFGADLWLLLVAFSFSSASSFEFNLSPSIQHRFASTAGKKDCVCSSRKSFMVDITKLTIGSSCLVLFPRDATAAGPITEKETDSLGVLARRALRPKPPKILRQKLSQDFAVLLMRSSYNALDQLDCVAMVGDAL